MKPDYQRKYWLCCDGKECGVSVDFALSNDNRNRYEVEFETFPEKMLVGDLSEEISAYLTWEESACVKFFAHPAETNFFFGQTIGTVIAWLNRYVPQYRSEKGYPSADTIKTTILPEEI